MKSFVRRLTPAWLLSGYHFVLPWIAAFRYGFPSRKMIVIGVTGTKGKSTTCLMIAKIIEAAGYKVGLASTALFKLGDREWLNPYKMSMLGRFKLQKLLRQMVDEGCRYAVVEVSSEGLKQHRHQGINFDIAVFTNLTAEHIEAHGSFEKYRAAKGKLFAKLAPNPISRKVIDGKEIHKVLVANLDSEHAPFYFHFKADEKIGFTMGTARLPKEVTSVVTARSIALSAAGSTFEIDSTTFTVPLLGQPNVENALAALAVAVVEHIPLGVAAHALGNLRVVPGRFEKIVVSPDFTVMVDYAHTPQSFERLYEAVALIPHSRIIHVFGGTGGGRDKAKRAEMGRIAGAFATSIIITTDDPYNEDPLAIAAMIRQAVPEEKTTMILDRREAIAAALRGAKAGDIVLVTGKGCEQRMAVKGGTIPWDDRAVVREEWEKIKKH